MFWKSIASLILKNKLTILICVAGLSGFMIFEASKVTITFDAGKVLPVTDSSYIRYIQFKKTFGQDATSMLIGFKSDKIFDKDVLNDWYQAGNSLKNVKGVQDVISIAGIYNIKKDTNQHSFVLNPLVSKLLPSAAAADSVKQEVLNLPFYKGLVLSNSGEATLMAITFDKKIINTQARVPVINKIMSVGQNFGKAHHLKVHFSGLPLIRTYIGNLVAHEFLLFLSLSVIITALILLIFFRSFFSVLFPVIIVVLGVLWSLGMLVLMHYHITILTGIIPPLVVIIGIPNSVFILNKFYYEYGISHNKIQALHIAIEKAGITTFIANITTAIGFAVLCFTNSELLTQFGLVAALSILVTFALSLILVPIIFSYLPPPRERQAAKSKITTGFLAKLNWFVHNKRKTIYVCTLITIVISIAGMLRINVNGYVVDDLPRNNNILSDLKFFESNFNGVLPLEVIIDSRHKNGIMKLSTIKKIEKLEKLISSYPQFSRAISLVQVLKFATQSFYGGNKAYYRLPDEFEQNFILGYAANSSKGPGLLNSYLDSNHQSTRVTFEMVDAGSKKMNLILAELQPRIDSILNPKTFHVELTGSSIIFIKGTNYLLTNLYQSLAWAILLIALVMWILFRNIRMIAISLLPNLVPLIITAGIMGFLGIPLKPSTILIFSIAMGISSDQTIYFITRYRNELKNTSKSISQIVSETIRETGVSMIFIATLLFCGFGIFAVSNFGGTKALGILLSITLLVAMITNLTLLPAFLLSLEKRGDDKRDKKQDEEN